MIRTVNAFLIALCLTSASFGQTLDDRYTFVIDDSDLTGSLGDIVELTVLLDFPTGDTLEGWSLGVCHSTMAASPLTISEGQAVTNFNGGSGADFLQQNVVPNGTEPIGTDPGINQGLVISFTAADNLPAGTGYELLTATYEIVGDMPGAFFIEFCDTTQGGASPVDTVVVFGANSLAANEENGAITVLPPPTTALKISQELTAPVNGELIAPVLLDTDVELLGASFGIAHDDTLNLVSIEPSGILAGLDPEIFIVDTDPFGATGGTVGFVVSITDPLVFIVSGLDQEIATFTYMGTGSATPGDTTTLAFTDSLQPVENGPAVPVLLSTGQSGIVPALLEDGQVTFEDPVSTDPTFSRADTNLDDLLNIADAITLLEGLFSGGVINCEKATDTNDDGLANVADAVYLLEFLFVMGPEPPAPFMTCAIDPTPDALTCDTVCIPQ